MRIEKANDTLAASAVAMQDLDSLILECKEDEKYLSSIQQCQSDNDIYNIQLNKLRNRIDKLEKVRNEFEICHMYSSQNIAMLLELQENDRVRIARDLHDTTVQELIHIIQKTELCMKYLQHDPNQVNLELASIKQSIRNTIEGARNIIYELRPMSFDDIGFAEAIQRLADDMMAITNFNIETDIELFENCCDYKEEYISLYRVITELVRNAIYHSGGNRIEISMKGDKKCIIVHVKDNGKGFDINGVNDSGKFGLQIVKNRLALMGGTISFRSDNNGTDAEIRIEMREDANDRSNVSR